MSKNEVENEKAKISCTNIPDPENMKIVHKQYSLLESAIDELGNKLSGILAKQESEFLGAYRAHMRNIQNDFKELRSEIEEKEKAIENNVKVKELEKERDWYRNEAMHLDTVLHNTKTNEENMIEKVDELEEERSWLTKQLKIVMKQKSSLEYQLDKLNEELNAETNTTLQTLEERCNPKDR